MNNTYLKAKRNLEVGLFCLFLIGGCWVASLLSGCAEQSSTAGDLAGAADPVAAADSFVAASVNNMFAIAARHHVTAEEFKADLEQMLAECRIIAATKSVATGADTKAAQSRLAKLPTDSVYASTASDGGKRAEAAKAAVDQAAANRKRQEAKDNAAIASKATRDAWIHAIMAVFIVGVPVCALLAALTRQPTQLANPPFVWGALGCVLMSIFCGVLPRILDSIWTLVAFLAVLAGGVGWFIFQLIRSDWTKNHAAAVPVLPVSPVVS